MTIDEAITRATKEAERQEYLSTQNHGYCEEKWNVKAREKCAKCATDHRQFAEWLTELKELQEENKVLTRDCLRLIKSNDKLRKRLKRMAEYKRLLKSATGIIKDVDCNEDYLCDECEYRAKCDGGFSFYWRYAAEAENLLNDEK